MRPTEQVPAPELRKSPMAIAATTLSNGAYVKIVYSSPRRRGRQIFGDLVPYGEVWRTGANEATELTTTAPIALAGHRVEPGTYALFTIPGRTEWTVILNRSLGQWGAYDYDQSTDVMRFEVPSRHVEELHEAFRITIANSDGDQALTLVWENTSVAIPITPR